jgi:hypothetical protein
MMIITESDLRDLLADESRRSPGGGVNVADVDRRVRRIRRRRLAAAATGVLAAGLAVTGVLTVPRTITAEVPDAAATAVMAQPSPSNSRLHPQKDVVAQQSYHRAGVKRRLTFQGTERTRAVLLSVTCPNSPSWAIIFLNGRLVWDEPCGKFEEGQFKAIWRVEGIDKKPGRNTVDVLVVPWDVPATGPFPTWRNLSPDERKTVLKSAKPYPAEWSVTVEEMAPGD